MSSPKYIGTITNSNPILHLRQTMLLKQKTTMQDSRIEGGIEIGPILKPKTEQNSLVTSEDEYVKMPRP